MSRPTAFWGRLSFFWKIYLAMLFIIFFPLLVFSVYDIFYLRVNRDGRDTLLANLSWSGRLLANQGEYVAEENISSWLAETEEASGLGLLLQRGERAYASPIARLHTQEQEPSFLPHLEPIRVEAFSASGQTKLTVFFEPPPRRPPPPPNLFARNAGILAVILLGILLSFLLVRNFMAPLREIRRVTGRLAKGDFSVRVGEAVTGRRDEIANLGSALNWMAECVENLVTAQKRLLRDISHEIRSPLQRMDVALALARNRANVDVEPYFERVEIEIERIDEMVEELLTLTREEALAWTQSGQTEIGEILTSIAADAEFEGQVENKAIQMTLERELIVAGDVSLIRRALGNVIYNAVRYTAPNSQVEIAAFREGESVVIRVKDCGPGVAESELENIFLPYYRTDSARERSRGGTGLGLAITKRIVENLGGLIGAFNSAGGGLVVSLRLPLLHSGAEHFAKD